MQRPVGRRATWLGAACVAAALAALAAGALPRARAVAAAGAGAAERPGQAAATCEPPEPAVTDADLAGLLQRLREDRRGDASRSDLVVLDNRGYHYGLPPQVRFDPLLAGRPSNANGLAR